MVSFRLKRNNKRTGQAGAVFNLILAVFLVGVLGIFAVELSRYTLAKDQLKDNVSAAALCCQTTLASTGSSTNANNQATAEQAGLTLFQQNSILGQPLSSANLVSLTSGQSTPQFDVQNGEAEICFQFLDPITRLPVNTSNTQNAGTTSPTGTLIQATGAYSYVPFFAKFLGLGTAQFTCEASSNSGIPQLDLVFVYDVSGAENTQTPVTYFQRYWHDPYGIDYLLPGPTGGSPTTPITGGPLSPFCHTTAPQQGPNPTTPMFLDNGNNCTNPLITYSELSGSPTQLLTGSQGYNAPPGNYPPPNSIWCAWWYGQPNSPYTALPIGAGDNVFVPTSPSYGFGTWVPLSQYYPTLASNFNSGFPTMTVGGQTDYIVYVLNGSTMPPAPAAPGQASGSVSSSTSNYQASIVLLNGLPVTVNLGGGSSFGAASTPLVPTGPHPAVNASSGGSPVQSFLSSFTYNDYGHVFTHSAVNIDNNSTFQNTTVNYNGNTYSFPSIGAVIEASLGNLESLSAAQAAGENLGALGLSQSNLQSGYYAAYMQAALASTQPMNTVANATIAFMNQIVTASDVHFGCVAFNDYTGTNATSTAPPSGTAAPDNIASDYPYPSINTNPGGSIGYNVTDTYLMPNILLNTSGNTTQSTIASVLPTIHTWGNCNVANALNTALTELNPQIVGSTTASPARATANKAIVLVTTQAPNVGLNGDTGSSALSDAIAQAQLANQSGIPIYVVSIAQSSSDDTNEDAAYNDNNNGIAATAGHGSKYYRVDWSNSSATQTALTSAFANIARQLVSVVH